MQNVILLKQIELMLKFLGLFITKYYKARQPLLQSRSAETQTKLKDLINLKVDIGLREKF